MHQKGEKNMRKQIRLIVATLLMALALAPLSSYAANKADIDRNARAALEKLCQGNISAKLLAEKAKAVLVFPSILKAGLIIGGQGGNGALIKAGKTIGYYNTAAVSYGLQAGVQEYGYAMFFMNDEALAYLNKSEGWEVGVGPSLVIVDKETAAAFGKNLSSTTLKDDIYAFIFSQEGLMAGIGIQGSKITKINPD
jgi:lipid-binding SYLF domain-containing protein